MPDAVRTEIQPLVSPGSWDSIASEKAKKRWSLFGASNTAARRYSIVATEVGILAGDIIYLLSKLHPDWSPKVGEYTLTALSFVGVVGLHYHLDLLWKTTQDCRFSKRIGNKKIMLLATARSLHLASQASLTIGNFVGAIQGDTHHPSGQAETYKDETVWGIVSIATGIFLTATYLYVTHRTLKRAEALNAAEKQAVLLSLASGEGDPFAADIRFCMDKDTLWDIEEKMPRLVDASVDRTMDLVKRDLNSQRVATHGGRLTLALLGDAAMMVEKKYTPTSLESAWINVIAGTAYAAKICIEKGWQWWVRRQVNQISSEPQPDERV
jgi:hypothetical protein